MREEEEEEEEGEHIHDALLNIVSDGCDNASGVLGGRGARIHIHTYIHTYIHTHALYMYTYALNVTY